MAITEYLSFIIGTQQKNQGRWGLVTARPSKVDQIPILDCLLG